VLAGGALLLSLEDDRDLNAPGYAYFSDNHISLLPAEQRPIELEWDGVPETDRRLAVHGWNTTRLTLVEAS
jgi:hypothetical protein